MKTRECDPSCDCKPPPTPRAGRYLVSAVVVAVVVGGALLLKSRRTTAAPEPALACVAPGCQPQTNALPKLVDLGTTTCAPCRVMLGVMADLRQRYPDAMKVEFVNVAEQPAEAERLAIRVIPTQIFFAPDGRELYRHVGVFRTEEVVTKWAELGFPVTPVARP